jgi:hypothetical protein
VALADFTAELAAWEILPSRVVAPLVTRKDAPVARAHRVKRKVARRPWSRRHYVLAPFVGTGFGQPPQTARQPSGTEKREGGGGGLGAGETGAAGSPRPQDSIPRDQQQPASVTYHCHFPARNLLADARAPSFDILPNKRLRSRTLACTAKGCRPKASLRMIATSARRPPPRLP